MKDSLKLRETQRKLTEANETIEQLKGSIEAIKSKYIPLEEVEKMLDAYSDWLDTQMFMSNIQPQHYTKRFLEQYLKESHNISI